MSPATVEMKKKLYGSVLLVGGGLALPGAAAALQSRLEMRVPQGIGGVVEVFANPRVCTVFPPSLSLLPPSLSPSLSLLPSPPSLSLLLSVGTVHMGHLCHCPAGSRVIHGMLARRCHPAVSGHCAGALDREAGVGVLWCEAAKRESSLPVVVEV